jgi:hypothetical protein
MVHDFTSLCHLEYKVPIGHASDDDLSTQSLQFITKETRLIIQRHHLVSFLKKASREVASRKTRSACH